MKNKYYRDEYHELYEYLGVNNAGDHVFIDSCDIYLTFDDDKMNDMKLINVDVDTDVEQDDKFKFLYDGQRALYLYNDYRCQRIVTILCQHSEREYRVLDYFDRDCESYGFIVSVDKLKNLPNGQL